MDAIQLFELQKICRICLKSDLLISIFSPSFLMRPIDMVEKLNIFKYDTEDNLPSLICQSCLYRLLDAFNLQQLSEASERRLRDYLDSTAQQISANCSTVLSNANSCERTILDNTSINSQCLEKSDDTDDIYDNICDMFDRNASNDIEVEDDVLNDVEIDVSSLTRSEAEDTIQDIIILKENKCVEQSNEIKLNDEEHVKKENRKALKTPDECEKCGKTFKYCGYLEAHMRTHTGEKPFQCKICHRRFAQSSNLLLHSRIHTGERRYQCEICSRFFTTSSNLKVHKQTHLETRAFECTRCTRQFKTQRELTKHELIHREVKEAICTICNKAFLKRSYLNVHMRTVHKRIRKHKCPACDKEFANKSNFVCHMRIHTGEKPYHCKFCTTKFNQSSSLVRHSKVHIKKSTSKNSTDSVEALNQTTEEDLLDFRQHSDNNNSSVLDESINNIDHAEFTREDILDYSRHHNNVVGYDFH